MMRLEVILNKIPYYTKAKNFIDCSACIGRALVNNIIHKPITWLKYRFAPQHRYHIINLCKSGNGYKHGWYDTDTRMLHACFLLLTEYVEMEKPFQLIDWDSDEQTKAIAEEIKDLYDWWKVRRPAAKNQLAIDWENEPEEMRFEPVEGGGFTIMQPSAVAALLKRSRELDSDDQRNLERLIKIRGYLWT